MFVILTYDVGVKRNSKVLKIGRRYLSHVQKSVFEGYISNAKLQRMKKLLVKEIDPMCDQVLIYKLGRGKIEKEVLGCYDEQSNII